MSKETFIKALENYFLLEQNPGLRQKHHVSTLLNSTNEPIDKIQERFNFFFSYTGSSRVKKYLDLIEFLSIHSPDKIIDAINTDKFVETIAAALMESEFQDTVCNLFRIWYDRYDVDRGRASKVLDMADNLANFGFNIPYNYKSKYEGIDIEAELAKLPEKKDENQGEKFPKVEIENRAGAEVFLSKADAVRDKAHGLLVNHNLAKMSDQTKKETVQSLGDEIKTLLAYKIAKTNTLDAEIKENIENAISALQRFLGELKEYGVKEEEESTSYGTYPRVYGPEPQPESWRNGYKDNESRQFPNMLSPDELMKYKTEPCEDQMRCKHAPKSRKGFQIGSLSKEIYCTGWHGMQDRRRQVLDEKGHTMYKFSMCNKKDECRNGDNCRKAHNFFEAFFHPMNYKSKRCAMVTVCKHGKYCPYFHSTEEKEHWVRVLKERFNFRSDDTYIDEPDLWGEDSNVTYSGMYENVMKHMPAGAAIPMEDMRSSSVNERTDYNEKKSYEPKAEILDIPSQKPKDKELCSTLVIRKRYVEPGKLTEPLYSNPCFYGVPLAVIGTQDLKEKYVPGKEQMNVAVIEDVKQVKENK